MTTILPRILCIDDNRDVADSTADLLGVWGYTARACYDGPSAIALAAVFVPCICLIDLHMPGMDGDEVALLLRAIKRSVVLLAVTAMANEVSCDRIKLAGFDLHLVKPVAPHRLIAAIESFAQARETA